MTTMDDLIDKLLKEKKIKYGNAKNNHNKEKAKLGHGGYGSVYDVEVEMQNNKTKSYAMKQIIINQEDKCKFDNAIKQTDKELSLCLNIKHRYIIRSKYKFQTEEFHNNNNHQKTFLLLMDKADYTNLSLFTKALTAKTNNNNEMNLCIFDAARKDKEGQYEWFKRMNEHLVVYFMKQLLYGIEYLHRNFLIHLDLKPLNVLISKGMELKICDFSLTSYVNFLDSDTNEKMITLKYSTFPFMGPEYFNNNKQIQRKYIPNVDIYSLGVMLYGLLFANRSFGKKWDNKSIPTKEDVMNVIQDKLDEINNDKYITNKCKDFFNKVLLQDITKRKNVYDLLEHPWINDNNEEFDICLLVNDDFSKKLIIESIKCGVVKRQIESCKSKSKLKNSKYNEHGFKRRKGCAKIKANFNPKVA